MKRKTFTPEQRTKMLQEHAHGKSKENICQEHGVSQAAFDKWLLRYGDGDALALNRITDLEEEVRKLKAANTELEKDLAAAKEALKKKP